MFGRFTEKYYPDGILQFEGNYKNGQANGYGKSYYQNGNLQYEGMWANGKYHGKGTLYNEAGDMIYSGEWRDGHKLSGGLRENFNLESDKLKKYLNELNSLIGLVSVKKELNSLINFVKLQRLRGQRGLNFPKISLHMIYEHGKNPRRLVDAREARHYSLYKLKLPCAVTISLRRFFICLLLTEKKTIIIAL